MIALVHVQFVSGGSRGSDRNHSTVRASPSCSPVEAATPSAAERATEPSQRSGSPGRTSPVNCTSVSRPVAATSAATSSLSAMVPAGRQVVGLAVGRSATRKLNQAAGGIGRVDEVARDVRMAVHDERILAGLDAGEQVVDDELALAGSVQRERTDRQRGEPVQPRVEAHVVLGGELGDAVRRDGRERVVLVHREADAVAVDRRRRPVHEQRRRSQSRRAPRARSASSSRCSRDRPADSPASVAPIPSPPPAPRGRSRGRPAARAARDRPRRSRPARSRPPPRAAARAASGQGSRPRRRHRSRAWMTHRPKKPAPPSTSAERSSRRSLIGDPRLPASTVS